MSKIFKSKKSKNKQGNSTQTTKGAKYICGSCGAEEIIPYEVLEEFDFMYPEELLHGPHMFKCERCADGIMQPEHYEAKIKGYGLYEGIDYTIKIEKQEKK